MVSARAMVTAWCVAGAAFGGGEVVEAAALEEVGALDEAEGGAGEDVGDRAGQAAGDRVVFLQQDAVEGRGLRLAADAVGQVAPLLVDEPLAAVVVVEERGVEAGGVEVDGIGPGAGDFRCGYKVVVGVLEVAVVALHVGVDQPEAAVGVAEAGGPDAAAVGLAAHVELAGAVERAGDEAPVHQVPGVVDLDAGVPLEGRGGDEVVGADADDRGVGVEALEDRVADHRLPPGGRFTSEGFAAASRVNGVLFDVQLMYIACTKHTREFARRARG